MHADRITEAEHAEQHPTQAAAHEPEASRHIPIKGGHLPPPATGVHAAATSASDQAFGPNHGGLGHRAHDHAHSGHPKPVHHGGEHPQSAHPHPAHPHPAHPPHAHPASHPAAMPTEAGPAQGPAQEMPAATGLTLGAAGPDVIELQQRLQAAGYYSAAIGGHFGPQTEAALRAFQRDHGLPDTGVADAATVDALRTATPAPAAPAPTQQGPAQDVPPATGADAAIAYGMTVLGAPYAAINPYRFGGVPWPGGSMVDIHGKERGPYPKGTQVFDCSGFVVTCWQHGGVNLLSHGLGDSHSIGKDKSFLLDVTADQLQPGDMIVDDGHIVLYIGGGQVIQSTPNGGVKISDAGSYIGKAIALKRIPG